MLSATRDWLDGLRSFAGAHRLRQPLVWAAFDAVRFAERAILAAWFTAWLAENDAVLEARRRAIAGGALAADADPGPALVVTTSPLGIGVAEEQWTSGGALAGAIAAHAVAVTELEYRLWCIRHPDETYGRHVNIWNWIKTGVPRQRHAEFARHPLGHDEAYWLHRAGIAGAGGADRRDCHLWKWNGREASLLEAFVSERGVSELG